MTAVSPSLKMRFQKLIWYIIGHDVIYQQRNNVPFFVCHLIVSSNGSNCKYRNWWKIAVTCVCVQSGTLGHDTKRTTAKLRSARDFKVLADCMAGYRFSEFSRRMPNCDQSHAFKVSSIVYHFSMRKWLWELASEKMNVTKKMKPVVCIAKKRKWCPGLWWPLYTYYVA